MSQSEAQRRASANYAARNKERRREMDRARYLRTKEQRLKQSVQWRLDNQEASRQHSRDRYKTKASDEPWYHVFYSAKTRAKRRGIEFTITRDDVEAAWTDNCPVFGTPFERGTGKQQDQSPSLDRLDPSKGYIPGNIAIISLKANRMKSDGTLEEHRRLVEWLQGYS